MDTKRKNRRRNENRKPDTLTMILGGAFVIVALVTAFFAFRFVREIIRGQSVIDIPGVAISSNNSDQTVQSTNETTGEQVVVESSSSASSSLNLETEDWDGESRVNILIMGLDYRDWEAGEEASRTDSMMVLTIEPNNLTAGLLSIPRDLWVNVPGFGQNKINTAYFLGQSNDLPGGGPALATQTVEEFLGIDIQYYAQIDFNTFVQFVDYIGGVKLDVPQAIELEIPGREVDVKLEPGRYNLSGELALAYVRNRYTGEGDFGRAMRQQQVLLALRDQFYRNDIRSLILGNAQEVWNIFSQGIQTNVPFDVAFQLGMLALDVEPENIIQRVISAPDYVTYATSPEGLEVLKPITSQIRILRDEMFTNSALSGPAASGADLTELMLEEGATVAVYNGSVVSGLAGATQDYLVSLGIEVVEVGNADLVPSTTIYDYTGNPYTLQYLVDLFGIENTRIFNSYDPDSTIDVAVILGSEWVVPTGE